MTDYDDMFRTWSSEQALVVLNGGMTRFGWGQGRMGLPVLACKGPLVASRAANAPPLFSFAAKTAVVRAVLARQSVTDWDIADETGAWLTDGLSVFRARLGTHLVLVYDEAEFCRACDGQRTLLMHLLLHVMRTGGPVAVPGGCVVPLWQFVRRPWLAKTGRGLIADLLVPAEAGTGWWALPFDSPSEAAQLVAGAMPDLPVTLWSCGSSALYGHEAILHRYIRVAGGASIAGQPVPILGKLQHGWQVGTGLDGELGFRLEVTMLKLPAYVWSRANLALARRAGIYAHAIGAPFLYLDDPATAPPPATRRLLAMPSHSVPEYRVDATKWRDYGVRMAGVARANGLDGVTVCLHPLDYEAACATIEATGCTPVQLVYPWDAPQEALLRFKTMVLAHAAVTADRVCSAGFYSLLCDRPFFVSGPGIQTTPVDPDEGPSGDPEWIAMNFPTLQPDRIDRDIALRELGAEYKRSPRELRDLIWGWLD